MMKKLAKPFEIKEIAEDGTFEGYGSVFGNTDSYNDVVEHGAFKKSLDRWEASGKMPAMLWQHKSDEPIGVWKSMREDEHGLHVVGRLLIEDDPLAKRAYGHLKAGSVGGLSVGYSLAKGGSSFDEKAGVLRLKEINLWETSLVTFPANDQAQVGAVKASEAILNIRDCEEFLREAGFSRSQAKGLLAGGFKSIQKCRDGEIVVDDEKTAADLIQNFILKNLT